MFRITAVEEGFLEAVKKRLAADTVREATSGEVKGLRGESQALKETLAELMLENRLLKKSMLGGGDYIVVRLASKIADNYV